MKPQTKRQHEIVRLSETLPQLTAKQRTYAFAHCFPHYGVQRAGGKVICTECGHAWREKPSRKRTAICPHCGQKLTLHQTKKRKFTGREYFCVITTCKGYQVVRYFLIAALFTTNSAAKYHIEEVAQHWIDANGQAEVIALQRTMSSWYNDAWSIYGDFEIRSGRDNPAYMVWAECEYPHKRYIPQLKRNGFDGNLYDMHPVKFFKSLLSDSTTETLLKAKQYSMLQHHVIGDIKKKYWSSVKICMRNGYIIPDASMWCDMVDMLRHFGKDVHNAKYVCPTDLQAAHDRLVRMREEEWERDRQEREQAWERERQEREQELRRNIKKYEKIYRKDKRKFFGLLITDGVINIRVLESVAAFEAEGKAMHHCVFANAYYLDKDALILSATIDDKRIETIEVSLQTFEVVQSRGVCNKDTEYHDRILKLMRDNAYLIQDRMKLAA